MQQEGFFDNFELDCPNDLEESTILLFSREYKIRTGIHFHDVSAYTAELQEPCPPIQYAWMQVPQGTREEAIRKLVEMVLHAVTVASVSGSIPGTSVSYDNLNGYVVFEGKCPEDFSIEKYIADCISLEHQPEVKKNSKFPLREILGFRRKKGR